MRLDLETLLDLAAVQTLRPGATCVMLEEPVGLREIQQEITELHMNWAVCPCLRWVCTFANLQVVCLDGDSSFERSPVINGKANPEFINDAHRWNKTPKYRANIQALPECLGTLVSLTTLSLERMSSLITLPSSLSQITGFTALTVAHCKLVTALPDLGPMPCLTKLVLKGAVCVGMPECVASWPLEQLELHYQDVSWRDGDPGRNFDGAQNTLAALVGRLAGTQRELT